MAWIITDPAGKVIEASSDEDQQNWRKYHAAIASRELADETVRWEILNKMREEVARVGTLDELAAILKRPGYARALGDRSAGRQSDISWLPHFTLEPRGYGGEEFARPAHDTKKWWILSGDASRMLVLEYHRAANPPGWRVDLRDRYAVAAR